MTKREKLIDLLQNMNDSDMVGIHNEYCGMVNRCDDNIYDIDLFDEIMQGLDPYTIACRVAYGDFNGGYEYFRFNGYGNIESICKYDVERFIDINEIVDYILENDEDMGYNDILYILDDVEEDSDDE